MQLQSPEGDNVYPVISAEMIKDSGGSTYDLSSLKDAVDSMGTTYATKTELEAVSADVEECFQSGSEGKSLVAAAVTDKGVQTAADATFQEIANNIGEIESRTSIDTIARVLYDNTSSYGFNYNSSDGGIVASPSLIESPTIYLWSLFTYGKPDYSELQYNGVWELSSILAGISVGLHYFNDVSTSDSYYADLGCNKSGITIVRVFGLENLNIHVDSEYLYFDFSISFTMQSNGSGRTTYFCGSYSDSSLVRTMDGQPYSIAFPLSSTKFEIPMAVDYFKAQIPITEIMDQIPLGQYN